MAIITTAPQNSGHWYTLGGESCHTIGGKTGERNTTLRDARKLDLLPSVTSVIGLLDKPQLVKWKVTEAIKGAVQLGAPEDGESVENFARRASNLSHGQVTGAAELGSKVHAVLEEAMVNPNHPIPDDMRAYVEPVLAWVKAKGIVTTESEIVLVNPEHGFAGRVDILFTWGDKTGLGILDFKTKKTKEGQKVTAYDEQTMQLAAYAATHYGEQNLSKVLAANLFISTTEIGRMEVVKHDSDKLVAAYEAFKNLCAVWRYKKGYDPRKGVN